MDQPTSARKPSPRWRWRSWDRESWYISIVQPTRCIIFEFIEYQSACCGGSFRPSSGVQDCTHSIRYMSYSLLASSQLTFMTYNWGYLYSLELLMMDGKTSETWRVIFNKLENYASGWFYYRNISRCTIPWPSKQSVSSVSLYITGLNKEWT